MALSVFQFQFMVHFMMALGCIKYYIVGSMVHGVGCLIQFRGDEHATLNLIKCYLRYFSLNLITKLIQPERCFTFQVQVQFWCLVLFPALSACRKVRCNGRGFPVVQHEQTTETNSSNYAIQLRSLSQMFISQFLKQLEIRLQFTQ